MRSISTFSVLALSTVLAAQPTLQFADLPTTAITLDWYLLNDPGNITEPSNGIGQTWDFTSATWDLAGTVTLAPAAGTPYAATYPAANYVFIFSPTGQAAIYAYLFVDASGIQTICGDAPINSEVYTDYKRVLQTPMSYNDAFTDTNDGSMGPGSETWTYTGAGTLQTTYGDFSNTVKTTRTADGRTTLWNSAPLFPRLTGNSSSVNLYVLGSTSIAEGGTHTTALATFPTPTAGKLTVSGIVANSRWSVLDAEGRVMQSGTWPAMGAQQMDLSDLAAGAYVLTVTDHIGLRSIGINKQ
ncbi:MAG: hypothetical protein ABI599_10125 [Flavobacteriales bacterium]